MTADLRRDPRFWFGFVALVVCGVAIGLGAALLVGVLT